MKAQLKYSSRKLALAYAGWWLFWSVVQAFVLHRLDLTWRISFTDSFVSNILLGLLSFSAIVLYRFYQPGKKNRFFRFVYAFGIAILFCYLLRCLLHELLVDEVEYLHFLERSMPIRFICALLIISFITILNWLWNILEQQKKQERRNSEAEQLIKEAELVRLRQQLQPHFLFNSLNSISALAGSKPEEARKMIQQLSDFLRGTLKKDEQKTVSVTEEIEHLQLYLEIEKVRFGHRLNVEMEVDGKILDNKIPPLLLQPLVENAIKFGLYGTLDKLTVRLIAKDESRYLFIQIQNPYDEQGQKIKEGTGFGLDSIRRRLLLLYGRNDLLTTTKTELLFITTLKIPQ